VSSDLTPLRWPGEWSLPSALGPVKNSPVNCILTDPNSPLTGEMRKLGLTTLAAAPAGVTVIQGEWPGIRAGQGRNAASGPTGVPWIDSNGWQIRLARVRAPGKPIWVETEFPKEKRVFNTAAYLRAMADAAMHGGRWVILVTEPESLRQILPAQRFFGAHREWGEGEPIAVVGILSDFSGENEFRAGELLNLTARLHQPYRILIRSRRPVQRGEAPNRDREGAVVPQLSFTGLKCIIYPDAEPLPPDLRAKLEAFVQSGGLLITALKDHQIRESKGRIAVRDLSDPYEAASSAHVLLSHRHDLVRFWNGGSLGSYLTRTSRGAMLQIINYSSRPGADPVSVRIAGPYREARIHLLENDAPKPLPSVPSNGAIELHLPAIPVYAAIELT
jgi:hypothetical protein